MPDLLLRDVDAGVVEAIAARAASHGVTPEEEHRMILMDVLEEGVPYTTGKKPLKDDLMSSADASEKTMKKIPSLIELLTSRDALVDELPVPPRRDNPARKVELE